MTLTMNVEAISMEHLDQVRQLSDTLSPDLESLRQMASINTVPSVKRRDGLKA